MKKTISYGLALLLTGSALMLVSCANGEPEKTHRKPVQYRLRQILMEPDISPERDTAIKQQAESILKRAQSGEDFTALAKRFSQEPGARQTGGDLGFFTFDQMVKPFSEAVFAMKPDDIRGPVKTQFGYHIIKLHALDGDKRHAQHILFMLTPDKADSLRVLETLGTIRKKLLDGEKFKTTFLQHNTYETLNKTDGFMVWQKPDDMLPSFARVVEGLGVGDVSKPFVSIIGFHIVVVDSINYNPDVLLTGFPAYIEERMK